MNQSKNFDFLRKSLSRKVKTRRKFFYALLAVGFVSALALTCRVPQVNYEFEWLRNKNFLPLFVRPELDTALLVPRDLNSTFDRNFIACYVVSCPENLDARNAIRRTWGEHFKPFFVIARRADASLNAVIEEAEKYDDIIIEDFEENYVNLTIKVAFAMKHFIRYTPRSKFFFKIDDDVFLNIDNLYKLLAKAPSDSLIGQVETHAKPFREKNHKWQIPDFLYGDDEFPPYLDGPAYLIPGNYIRIYRIKLKYFQLLLLGHMVHSIYDEAMRVPFFTLEDVFYTGYVAGKLLNFRLHDSRKFRTIRMSHIFPCAFE